MTKISHQTSAACAPGRLLATLAQWFDTTNDHELAAKLQVSARTVQGLRSGHIAISPSLLLLMAECAGRTADELRALLCERRRKARMSRDGGTSISA